MLQGFFKIGEYREPNQDASYIEFIGRRKSVVIPIVYLFVVDQQIKYIGESRRGFSRPLSYNKNAVMKKQRDGILGVVSQGKVVEVYAIEVPKIEVNFNGVRLDCYVAQDYEKHLIDEFEPEWNGRR